MGGRLGLAGPWGAAHGAPALLGGSSPHRTAVSIWMLALLWWHHFLLEMGVSGPSGPLRGYDLTVSQGRRRRKPDNGPEWPLGGSGEKAAVDRGQPGPSTSCLSSAQRVEGRSTGTLRPPEPSALQRLQPRPWYSACLLWKLHPPPQVPVAGARRRCNARLPQCPRVCLQLTAEQAPPWPALLLGLRSCEIGGEAPASGLQGLSAPNSLL